MCLLYYLTLFIVIDTQRKNIYLWTTKVKYIPRAYLLIYYTVEIELFH